ncbi:MAG: hypothetical protein VB064_02595 [Oscillospiraceae bacterium]|nr:hypothetical protein [Oscillospiraceae bacterium]
MKKRKSFFWAVLALAAVLMSPAWAASAPGKALSDNEKVSRQQLEAQVTFFNKALLEFGAASADEAVRLWVKGDQTRNGVYKYSVSCDQLKKRFISGWGVPEKSFWIIGGSSPWLENYEIISKANISPTEIMYVVQYHWATSAGPEAPSAEKLLIKKVEDNWCVLSVVQSDGYHSTEITG